MQFHESEKYCIGVPKHTSQLMFAAEELRDYLIKIVGCQIDILRTELPLSCHAIYLATQSQMEERGCVVLAPLPDVDSGDGREAYVIDIGECGVSFIGNRPRSVLYAVYDFLREDLGCEFVLSTEGIELIPSHAEITVPTKVRQERADFACRGNGFHGEEERPSSYFAGWIDWLAKMRFNRIQLHVSMWDGMADEVYPEIEKRDLDLDLGVHELNYFLPAERYFADHADWYADIDSRWGRQIRFSNLDSIEVISKNILSYLASHPEITYLGLWPLDGTAFQPSDIASGKMSDIVLTYVNRVVERVSAVFPNLRYDHLAYIGYASPPKATKPHAQITTSVCHYWDRNFTRPIYDAWYGRKRFAGADTLDRSAKKFHPLRHHRDCCEQLAAWTQISKTIVFCYYIDLNLSTHNLFDLPPIIQKDLQYYRTLGVDGLLNCFCFHAETLWLYRDLHAFGDLMWNVNLDWRKRQGSLLRALFANAAPAMERFYDSLNALQNEPLWSGCSLADMFRGLIPAYELAGYLPQLHEAVLSQLENRFAETLRFLEEAASKSKENPEILNRISGIKFNIDQQKAFARLGCYVLLGFQYGDAGAKGNLPHAEAKRNGLAATAEALRIFNAWHEDYLRGKPSWVHLERKIAAYRVALEVDFPEKIRKQLCERKES